MGYYDSKCLAQAGMGLFLTLLLPGQHFPLQHFGSERLVTIYIGNLSFQASEDDIRDVFAEYGEVTRISLPIDRETGRKRGFAFVDMADEAKEDQAISELDGAEWLGRELRVNKARPRTENNDGGGGTDRPNRSNRFSHNPL
jgi:RNA recognition motif-containing protein